MACTKFNNCQNCCSSQCSQFLNEKNPQHNGWWRLLPCCTDWEEGVCRQELQPPPPTQGCRQEPQPPPPTPPFSSYPMIVSSFDFLCRMYRMPSSNEAMSIMRTTTLIPPIRPPVQKLFEDLMPEVFPGCCLPWGLWDGLAGTGDAGDEVQELPPVLHQGKQPSTRWEEGYDLQDSAS